MTVSQLLSKSQQQMFAIKVSNVKLCVTPTLRLSNLYSFSYMSPAFVRVEEILFWGLKG